MAKQTPEQELLDRQRVYDGAIAVERMKNKRQAEAYQQLQGATEQAQGRYQANPVLQQYLNSNPDVFRAATNAAIQSGVPKQGSRFTGGISNEYQNVLDDFARQHYRDFGQKENRGIEGLPTVGRIEMENAIREFTPREFTEQNYGYNPLPQQRSDLDNRYAEGGPVMGGMQPMTAASQNSGIASGMMPPAPPPEGMMPPAPPPEGAEMMQQMAGQMEQVYNNLDNSENIEDVINAMRGDELPLSERYSELADLVGPDDAKSTPESVLTVLQPTFQMLNSVPTGGIADATAGGTETPEGNFNEPSATSSSDQAEAVLAMSRGEMPVGMRLGGMPMPFTQNYTRAKKFPSINSMNNAQTAMGDTVPQSNNNAGLLPYMPSKLAPPVYEPINFDAVRKNMNSFQDLQKDISLEKGETDPAIAFANRQKLLSQFAPKAETAEELLARRKEFMGDTGSDSSEIQGYLALAQAGSQLASTPGSLLTGLTQAAGPLAGNLSKIAADKTKREFESKGAAFDLRQANIKEADAEKRQIAIKGVVQQLEDDDEISKGQTKIVTETIADVVKTNQTVDNIESQLLYKVLGKEVATKITNVKEANAQTNNLYNKQMLFEGEKPQLYWKVGKDGSIDPKPITVRRTGEGLKYYENGEYRQIPEGYVPIETETQRKLFTTGGVDTGTVKKINMVVPDPNSETGYSQKMGVYSDKLGYALVDQETGVPQFNVPLPAGTIEGKYSDVVSVSDPDGVGRVFTTITPGDGTGSTTFMSKVAGREVYGTVSDEGYNQVDADGKPIGTPKMISVASQRTLQNAPKFAEYANIDGKRVLTGGTPLLIPRVMGPEVNPAELDTQFIKNTRIQIAGKNQALNALRDLLKNIPDGGGLKNNLKRLVSSNLSQFTPEAISAWTRWAESDRAKQEIELFRRNVQQSFALSNKYAMGEQLITGKLAPQIGVFTDPIQGFIYAQTLATKLQNDITELRLSVGDNTVDSGRLLAPKTGQQNDPIPIFDNSLPKEHQDAYFQHFGAKTQRENLDTSKSFISGTENQFRILFEKFAPEVADQFINTATRGNNGVLVMPASNYFGSRVQR